MFVLSCFTEQTLNLASVFRCLEAVIQGCGPSFNLYIDQELLDLIFYSLNHTNRFVRETGYYVCGALVSCNTSTAGAHLITVQRVDTVAGSARRPPSKNWLCSKSRFSEEIALRAKKE